MHESQENPYTGSHLNDPVYWYVYYKYNWKTFWLSEQTRVKKHELETGYYDHVLLSPKGLVTIFNN